MVDEFKDTLICQTKIQQNDAENAEVYNMPFSLEELQDTLRRAHDTSAGPDEIHSAIEDTSLLLLLNISK